MTLSYRLGDSGPAVAEIRIKLAQLGLLDHTESGVPLNTFDIDVDHAVRQFQQERGLIADGVVGPATYCPMSWPTHSPATTCWNCNDD
jgi:N-acetylmuramoyl-L-alanine amidase